MKLTFTVLGRASMVDSWPSSCIWAHLIYSMLTKADQMRKPEETKIWIYDDNETLYTTDSEQMCSCSMTRKAL